MKTVLLIVAACALFLAIGHVCSVGSLVHYWPLLALAPLGSTMYRQPTASDFHANELPTLNARLGQMPCIYSERFDTERLPLVIPGYSNALAFPAGWQVFDPGGNAGFAFVDATQKCGCVAVSSIDGVGGISVAGMVRPWPKMPHQDALIAAGKQLNWRLFARVAQFLQTPTGPNTPTRLLFGLLFSTSDLIASPVNPFLLVGDVFNEAGGVEDMSQYNSVNSSNTIQVISAFQTVQLNITYDPGLDLTAVSYLVSPDGVGFVAGPANSGAGQSTPATVFYKGLPKTLGLAVDIAGQNDPALDSFTMRCDYIHLFGSSADAANALAPAIAEGGQTFSG